MTYMRNIEKLYQAERLPHKVEAVGIFKEVFKLNNRQISKELDLDLRTADSYISLFMNYKYPELREKNKLAKFEKMSIAVMAKHMCDLLIAKQSENANYSMRIYQETSGNFEASLIKDDIKGHVLHYLKDNKSYVSMDSFSISNKQMRQTIWRYS